MASSFSDYFNRFTPGKRWEEILFRAGNNRGLQSAELNELQSILSDRMTRLGRGVYQDGHVVEGATCTVLPEMANPLPGNPNIRIEAGRVALRGTVYDTEETLLEIPNDKLVWVGIRFKTTEQDEFADPDLVNPAIGTRGYQEPGAARLRADWTWGWKAEDDTDEGGETAEWDFYPVFEVDHGVFVFRQIPGGNDPLVELLAKYDREAHGNYVVRGFDTTFVEERVEAAPPNKYVFDIEGGLADIQGFKLERRPTTQMAWDKDPTLVDIVGEPHHYDGSQPSFGHPPPPPWLPYDGPEEIEAPPPPPSLGGRQTIFLNRNPVVVVDRVLATIYKSIRLSKGDANGEDSLPDPTVVDILTVQTDAGGHVWIKGTDWQQDGDKIDWSLGGSEPTTGTMLLVTYTYEVDVLHMGVLGNEDVPYVPEVGIDHIVVQNLYPDTDIFVDYSWALPRKDLIVLTADGDIDRLVGVSQIRNPTAPHPSDDQVALATVEYTWGTDPKVENVSPKAIPMTELHRMRDHIFDLYELMAIVALKGDQGLRGESERLGIFVDPFISEDTRDYGIAQKAVTAEASLQLPVPSEPYTPDGAAKNSYWTLPFNLEELASQPAKTACLPIVPIFVVPPPIIEPPPPPPPVTRHRRFTAGSGVTMAPNRTDSIEAAVGDAPQAGVLWMMENRYRYNPPLPQQIKDDVAAVAAALVDTGSAGTYWGDHTPGVPNADHNREGVITIDDRTYNWFTRITERIFTDPPLNLRVWFPTLGTAPAGTVYEWTGSIPADNVVNAKIADIMPEFVSVIQDQVSNYGAWSSPTKAAINAFVSSITTPALELNQLRHTVHNISGNRYEVWWGAEFQPNHHQVPGGSWVHRLTTGLAVCGPRDEDEPNVSAIFNSTLIIRGEYDTGEIIPPRRRINAPPPTVPNNSPPIQLPPEIPEETFADPDQPIRFSATGFKPQETVEFAVVDGESLPISPRSDFDDSDTLVTEDIEES